jgi:hypothetical protein
VGKGKEVIGIALVPIYYEDDLNTPKQYMIY